MVMIEITFPQMVAFITVLWIFVRGAVAYRSEQFSLKRELQMLLVYICIVVISRFVYFEFHLVDGKIEPLRIGPHQDPDELISFKPFFFLVDRYDGWLMNVIGNIAMFIPVGIVWPICFKELDTYKKTVLAGFGYTLLIEISQLICYGRHTDIDDLILNTMGVAIGAMIVFVIRKIRNSVHRGGKYGLHLN